MVRHAAEGFKGLDGGWGCVCVSAVCGGLRRLAFDPGGVAPSDPTTKHWQLSGGIANGRLATKAIIYGFMRGRSMSILAY